MALAHHRPRGESLFDMSDAGSGSDSDNDVDALVALAGFGGASGVTGAAQPGGEGLDESAELDVLLSSLGEESAGPGSASAEGFGTGAEGLDVLLSGLGEESAGPGQAEGELDSDLDELLRETAADLDAHFRSPARVVPLNQNDNDDTSVDELEREVEAIADRGLDSDGDGEVAVGRPSAVPSVGPALVSGPAKAKISQVAPAEVAEGAEVARSPQLPRRVRPEQEQEQKQTETRHRSSSLLTYNLVHAGSSRRRRRLSSVTAAPPPLHETGAGTEPNNTTVLARLNQARKRADAWWTQLLRRYWALQALLFASTRLLHLWDVVSDALVAYDLSGTEHVWWFRIVASLVLLPRVICALALLRALRAYLSAAVESPARRALLLCGYAALAVPGLFVLDLLLASAYLFSNLSNTQHLLYYDQLRTLTESLFESVPQGVMQIYISVKLSADVNMSLLLASIAVSVVCAGLQITTLRRNAEQRGDTVVGYLQLVLRYGVGYVPFLEGIRSGQLPQADYSGFGLQLAGVEAVADAVTSPGGAAGLRAVDLSHNDLDEPSVLAVAGMLERSPGLRELSLACNDVGPGGARALAVAVAASGALRRLLLSDCAVCGVVVMDDGDGWVGEFELRGAEALCAAATHSASLQHLDLAFNGLGAAGAACVARLVADSKALRVLGLSANRLAEAVARDEERAVDVGDCDVSGVVALAQALPASASLVAVDLSDNDLCAMGEDLAGIEALAAALRAAGDALRQVDLRFNDVGVHVERGLFASARPLVLLEPGEAPAVDVWADDVVDVGLRGVRRARRGSVLVR